MTREILLVVTSKDTQTSSNGSSVQMTFQPALTMGAQSTIKLIGANVWYAMPNIAAREIVKGIQTLFISQNPHTHPHLFSAHISIAQTHI